MTVLRPVTAAAAAVLLLIDQHDIVYVFTQLWPEIGGAILLWLGHVGRRRVIAVLFGVGRGLLRGRLR